MLYTNWLEEIFKSGIPGASVRGIFIASTIIFVVPACNDTFPLSILVTTCPPLSFGLLIVYSTVWVVSSIPTPKNWINFGKSFIFAVTSNSISSSVSNKSVWPSVVWYLIISFDDTFDVITTNVFSGSGVIIIPSVSREKSNVTALFSNKLS